MFDLGKEESRLSALQHQTWHVVPGFEGGDTGDAPVELLVTYDPEAYQAKMGKALRNGANPSARRRRGSRNILDQLDDLSVSTEAFRKSFVGTHIRDWRGVEDKGEPVPFNEANWLRAMRSPVFAEGISLLMDQLDDQYCNRELAEVEAKN